MPVYFLQAPDAGLIKIGFVSKPERAYVRAASLQCNHRTRVGVLSVRDGDRVEECRLLMRHCASWAIGEWFGACPAILAEARGEAVTGPGLVDMDQVRSWLRSWPMPLHQIAALAGISISPLVRFADGAAPNSGKVATGIGRAYLVAKLGLPSTSFFSFKTTPGAIVHWVRLANDDAAA